MPNVSEARLSSVLDIAVDGILVIDEEARILVFNKACERLYGYAAAEVIGRSASMLMPEDHPYRGNVPAYVEQLVNAAGVTREEMARLAQLQSDLLQMARVSAMDEMGAAVAHELNQPLTALMLYLQAVARSSEKLTGGDGAVQPQLLAILEKAVHEAERAGAIVQRMRQFVERHEPARQLVDLRPLLDEAIDLIQLGNWPRPDITRDFAADLPAVLVDPVQIQQILVNLLRNALRAVKDHAAPEIRVTARTGANLVAVTVTDNGAGIPAERVPTLFKAFASNKGSGLGLGLAISRTIAQTHGGDLTVDPGGDGRGACLTLHLPLPVLEAAAVAGSIRLGTVNGPDAETEVSDARRN